jgi:EAL domain-containing protein (putative c-di-GMP-specific phosphodiesterase class I)/CheY-like chemotaxis protein
MLARPCPQAGAGFRPGRRRWSSLAAAASASGEAVETFALHVLVLEDHGFQRRMALRMLAELGVARVDEASDGASALALLEALPSPPDLVLVDLDMPGMDGIEFIGHVAGRHLARAIALVSAMEPALINSVQTVARDYGLHVLGSIEKPVTIDKLEATLASYAEQRQEIIEEEALDIEFDEVRTALAEGRIEPWFQPQVELLNGRVLAVEALARWKRDGQVVRPMQFVPLLERAGLGRELTDAMLVQACGWKRRWDQADLRLQVAVNVSHATLVDPAVADHFQAQVKAHGVEPGAIMFEITESALMADRGLSVLARLRLKGFGLSIDDFGTGYSSLAQLSEVPFTELKIDRGFVSGAPRHPRKRAVIEASLVLARKLELGVVAEGVESVEEWQMLSELGCDAAQGFLISRAVPGGELAEVIARWRRP